MRWLGMVLIFVVQFAQATALPDFATLVDKNAPSVVKITTVTRYGGQVYEQRIPEIFRHFFGDQFRFETPEREAESLGSGFIISADGYVLTNHHVVDGATIVRVKLADQREFDATVVGTDRLSDIAVLKIDGKGLQPVAIGDSEALRVGDWVLAIGSPFGLDYSATAGIVSAKRRPLQNQNYVPFIQTDVAINPGNSGGPLFNLDGEVVGVNSQIFTRTGGYMGMSFAIPIHVAMDVYEQLRDKGAVSRGWLGVMIQDVDHNLAQSFGLDRPRGALIADVVRDGPADEAGLRAGDVVLAFDGNAVNVSGELPHYVGRTPVGEAVPVEILREGKRSTLRVKVGTLPEDQVAGTGPQSTPNSLGGMLADITDAQKAQLGVEGGILVQQVGPGALAEAKVERGDVITMLNNQPVESVKGFLEQYSQLPKKRWVAMQVYRRGTPLFLSVYTGD